MSKLQEIMKIKEPKDREIKLREYAQSIGCSLNSTYDSNGRHLEDVLVSRIIEAEQNRREDVTSRLDELRKSRYLFLKKLWELSDGNIHYRIQMIEVGKQLEFEESLTEKITYYLKDEGLLKFVTLGGFIAITHYGIKEIEASICEPSKPTEHFPAINIVNVGQMNNSQIQQSSPNAVQKIIIKKEKYEDLKKIIEQIQEVVKADSSDRQEINDLKAELETIKAQLSHSNPKASIIGESLDSVIRIIENATGNIVSMGILEALKNIYN